MQCWDWSILKYEYRKIWEWCEIIGFIPNSVLWPFFVRKIKINFVKIEIFDKRKIQPRSAYKKVSYSASLNAIKRNKFSISQWYSAHLCVFLCMLIYVYVSWGLSYCVSTNESFFLYTCLCLPVYVNLCICVFRTVLLCVYKWVFFSTRVFLSSFENNLCHMMYCCWMVRMWPKMKNQAIIFQESLSFLEYFGLVWIIGMKKNRKVG